MDRKILVIWNPFSGGRAEQIMASLTQQLKEENLPYELVDTRQTKSATRSVRQHLDHTFSDLIIVGGDGTLNEAINGLNRTIPISILPAGTGDDFVKNLNIGKTLAEQIRTALYGNIRSIDLGVCNGRKFVNGVGIGFDGQIVEDMAVRRTRLLSGHLAYYYHVLRILGGYKERCFTYQLDEQRYTKDLILLTIGNGTTFGGGFKLMPHAKMDDGLLDVCEIGKISGLRRFLNIHKLSKGTHHTLREVHLYQAKNIYVASNDLLFAHIDGERLGQPPFDISILPQALQVRMQRTS